MKHRVEDYITKLLMQTRISVLVEGKSDRSSLSQIIRTQSVGIVGREIIIDTVDQIDGFPQDVLGNWERVEHVAEQVVKYTDLASKDCFRALVDRDFRWFELSSLITDCLSRHLSKPPLHWTRGHSLENYFIKFEYCKLYLIDFFGEYISDSAIERLRSVFASIVNESVFLSIALHEAPRGGRLCGSIGIDLWQGNDIECMSVSWEKLELIAIARNLNVEEINKIKQRYMVLREANFETKDDMRWCGHGKVASRILWAGIGAAFEKLGVSNDVCHDIATRDPAERNRRCSRAWVDCYSPASNEHPVDLVTWCGSASLVSADRQE